MGALAAKSQGKYCYGWSSVDPGSLRCTPGQSCVGLASHMDPASPAFPRAHTRGGAGIMGFYPSAGHREAGRDEEFERLCQLCRAQHLEHTAEPRIRRKAPGHSGGSSKDSRVQYGIILKIISLHGGLKGSHRQR